MKKYGKYLVLPVILAAVVAVILIGKYSGKNNADDVLTAKQSEAESENEEKVLGKAEFVNASTEYFDTARLNRQETRDKAVGILQEIVDSEEASEQEKEDARNRLLAISEAVDAEGRIENLVKAKGYTECLAIIGDDSVNVIVQTEGLESADVASIKDIASEESAQNASEIKIIESK